MNFFKVLLTRVFSLVLLWLVALPASASWPSALGGCQVFDRENERAARVVFAAGPMATGRDETGFERQHRPDPPLIDAGKLQLTVYDCVKSRTAFGVAADLRRQLRRTGWKIDFACDGEDCGPRPGWVALLPELRANPPEGGYSYALAHRLTNTGMVRIAFFITDIDDRPRVMMQRLSVNPDSAIKLELDLVRAEKFYRQQKPAMTLYFPSGSNKPESAPEAVPTLTQGKWVVVGHADHRGSESRNGLLSWQRARRVSAWLQQQGVKRADITQYAVGDMLAQEDAQEDAQASAENLGRQRRVDVFYQPIQEKQSSKVQISGSLAGE